PHASGMIDGQADYKFKAASPRSPAMTQPASNFSAVSADGETVSAPSRPDRESSGTFREPGVTQTHEPTAIDSPAGDLRDTLPGTRGYEVLEGLGRGGRAVVYTARQKGLNRLVALKMIKAGVQAEPHQIARFHTEAEAVAQLQHPNIVQIYEVGE